MSKPKLWLLLTMSEFLLLVSFLPGRTEERDPVRARKTTKPEETSFPSFAMMLEQTKIPSVHVHSSVEFTSLTYVCSYALIRLVDQINQRGGIYDDVYACFFLHSSFASLQRYFFRNDTMLASQNSLDVIEAAQAASRSQFLLCAYVYTATEQWDFLREEEENEGRNDFSVGGIEVFLLFLRSILSSIARGLSISHRAKTRDSCNVSRARNVRFRETNDLFHVSHR